MVNLLEISAGKFRIEFAESFFRNETLARLLDIEVATAEPVAPRQVVFRPFRLSRPLCQRQGDDSLILHAAHQVGLVQAFRQGLAQRLDVEGQRKAFNAGARKKFGHLTAGQLGGNAALD